MVLTTEAVELVEREREQAALVALVTAACRGAGRLVAVEGAAGIGKTRLLTAARAEAERAGMRVLAARGMELEGEFAYGVVRQLFEPALAGASETERGELLAGHAGQARALFDQPDPVHPAGGDASFAIAHGLFWLVMNLCTQSPLLLCIDDLHWADTPSLRFFAHLLPRLEGLALLVLVALRPAEPGADQHLLAQIVTDPSATLLHPAPLSQTASARLVRAVLGKEVEEEFCAACHAATGGNPLLLCELARLAATEGAEPTVAGAAHLLALGSRAIGRRVRLRLARLGPTANAVCAAVAILGDNAMPVRVAALAGLDLTEAMDAARQLTDAEILYRRERVSRHEVSGPSMSRWGFVHPLVRDAVYEELPETERVAARVRAARMLADMGAEAERVAAHLFLVPPMRDPFTVTILRQAADEALARGSPDSAVAYLERCLQEPPEPTERVDVLITLGAAAQLVNMDKATKHLTTALALSEQRAQRGLIAEMLGRTLNAIGRYDDAFQVYAHAIEALGNEHADTRRRLDAGLLGVAMTDPGLLRLAAERADHLRDEPTDTGLGSRMLDTTIALYDARAGAPLDAAVSRAQRGLADRTLIGQLNTPETLVYGCLVLMAADLYEVMQLFDAWLAHAHRRRSSIAVGAATCFRALAWLWRGNLAEAERDARDALEVLATTHPHIGPLFAAPFLASALREQGRLAEAAAVLAGASVPEPLPRAGHWHWVLDSRARLMLAQGRTTEGLEELLACGRRFTAQGGRNPAVVAWRSGAALALLKLGRREEARALATEELALACRWGAPRALGRALRTAGLIEGGEQGLALLREAVAVLVPSPARLEHAKALVDLGAALRRTGQHAEAREHLRRGIEQAQVCGAAPLTERGWAELRAAGVRRRPKALSGPQGLTPSERRVAELAAAGCSNRDIAQALFVTINTVETHLTRTYQKLGIKRRTDLAQALHTLPAA
jgi:DNA-binding CsgD family transcriptional regulator